MYSKYHPIEQMTRKAIAQEFRRVRVVLAGSERLSASQHSFKGSNHENKLIKRYLEGQR